MRGTFAQAQQAKLAVEKAQHDLDKLGLLGAKAQVGFDRASRREQRERAELLARMPEAQKTLASYTAALPAEFPKLAGRLAEIVQMEAAGDQALKLLRQASALSDDVPTPVAPEGPRLRGHVLIPGHVERPRAVQTEADI